jgi:CRP-like cAMP-binding protein
MTFGPTLSAPAIPLRLRRLHPPAAVLARAPAAARSNALLAQIPLRERERLKKLMKPVSLTFGEVLHEAEPIRHVYFPVDCLVSLFAPLARHSPIEIGLVGSEGMVGVALALGARTAFVQALVQGSGTALKMEAAAFKREFRRNAALQAAVHRYIHMLMGQVSQTAACNALHTIEARSARWLLMTRDGMQSDTVELTHEFLARMLGVRRVGVTVAAGNLQRQGLIAYSRGHITVLDAEKLERKACECYGTVRSLYEKEGAR